MTEGEALPSWVELTAAVDDDYDLNPVEEFLHENEPAGKNEGYFRNGLIKALNFAAGSTVYKEEPCE